MALYQIPVDAVVKGVLEEDGFAPDVGGGVVDVAGSVVGISAADLQHKANLSVETKKAEM